jgi:hypothetical protein
MVYDAAHAVSIPVTGMGEISTTADVAEFILAGATARCRLARRVTGTLVRPKKLWMICSGGVRIGELDASLI